MAYPNKFPGTCRNCGKRVAARQGLMEKIDGKWFSYHKDGDCPEVTANPFKNFKPDQYQKAVHKQLMTGAVGSHIMILARAGSGKTTTQCWAMTEVHKEYPALKMICLAFGTEDGERMREKLPASVEGSTTHSFGKSLINSRYKSAKLNKKKDEELVEMVVGPDKDKAKMREYVQELLSKIKADTIAPDDLGGIKDLIKSYEISIPEEEQSKAVEYANKTLNFSMDINKFGYNFDDMIYLPALLDFRYPAYDIVGVDESQDFCNSQLVIIQKMIATGARVIAVGDPNQSLYVFRGARHDSFFRIRTALENSDRGVTDLPMPRSYRNANAIIRLAKTIVSDIEAMPDAEEGQVRFDMPLEEMLETIGSGDMVLCRVNAPLIRLAWYCINNQKKFYMRRGEKEAGWLIWLVNMSAGDNGWNSNDVSGLLDRLDKWLEERKQSSNGYRLTEYADKVQVIKMIAENCLTVKDVIKEIRKIFTPPVDKTGCIVLTTIHGAKGSEANRVFHLAPHLCPHPKATTEEQIQQEINAKYVAWTRAKTVYCDVIGDMAEVAIGETNAPEVELAKAA